MTYFVSENCIKCRYTDCTVVCPVDCFHAGPNFLVIDPDVCIDCGVCVPECPADAIYSENDSVPDKDYWLRVNAELAVEWPVITEYERPAEDADDWNGMPDKKQWLIKQNR